MRCEWKQVKLGDVATVKGGKRLPKNVNLINTPNTHPYIRVRDLNDRITLELNDSFLYVDDETQKGISRYVVNSDDIVISIVGTIGLVAKIGKTLDGANLTENCVKITNLQNIDKEYLFYYLKSVFGQQEIMRGIVGAVQQNLPIKNIQEITIKCPELIEQKKIAAILSALDEKIAINRAINDNLQQQAASIFTKWLSTCADASTIGDMSYNILDYSPVGSEQIRLLNSSDVTEGVFPIAPLVPNKDLKGHFKKRFKFGDILYSEIRPRNHHYGFVLFDASDYIASTRLMVIRAIENKVSPAMLYQYLLLPEVEAEFTLKTESRSGTFPQGNYADMASIRVPYSPTDSQVAISETLTQIRYNIAQNQLESQRLAELRDTLLPKLTYKCRTGDYLFGKNNAVDEHILQRTDYQ